MATLGLLHLWSFCFCISQEVVKLTQERLTFGTVTTMKEVRVKTYPKISRLSLALGSALNLCLSVYCLFATFAKVQFWQKLERMVITFDKRHLSTVFINCSSESKREPHCVWTWVHICENQMKFKLSSSNHCEDRSRPYVGMMALLIGRDSLKRRQWLHGLSQHFNKLWQNGKQLIAADSLSKPSGGLFSQAMV